jgi:hypothetical protein
VFDAASLKHLPSQQVYRQVKAPCDSAALCATCMGSGPGSPDMHVGSCLLKSLTDSCVMAEVTKFWKDWLVSFSCCREQLSRSSTICCQQRGGRAGSAASVVACLGCVANDVLNGIL